MLRKMGKKITNNFGLKLLATVLAMILWIVVASIDDPLNTKPYTTSITIENADFITQQNKCYEVLDGNNTFSFQVSAKRSVHDLLSNSDFTATADMKKIEYNEKTGNYRVPITVTASKYTNSVTITTKQLYKEVELMDLGKVQKQIVAVTKGTVADGCALGTVKIVGSNLMRIQGPADIVNQVASVSATINVDGMSTDVTDNVVPVLYDADGNAIDTTKLSLNVSTVSISAQILNTKDVTIEFSATGEPAEGYRMTEISYEPKTVRIKGEPALLNPINKIVIPERILDITGATETIETIVDITSYLPTGISLVLSSDAKVEVRVTLEPLVKKTLEVPAKNLSVEGLDEKYLIDYVYDTVAVEVSGVESALDALRADQITGIADATDLSLGEHYLAVKLNLDEEQFQETMPVKVLVEIRENQTDSNAESEEQEQNNTDKDEKEDTQEKTQEEDLSLSVNSHAADSSEKEE